jgi:hypothetical protein
LSTQPETAVATTEDQPESRLDLYTAYDPNMDFRKLALEATYFAKGFRLIDNKDALEGVPFVVLGVTYREGFPREGQAGDYVSIEAVVADKDTLASPPVRSQLPSEMTVFPNEAIVFNDSSTGVRRTLTELFHTTGLIDVGTVKGDLNPYDKPFQSWKAGADQATTGIVATVHGEPFRYLALRGLRRSDYEWQGQPATTYYFG